MGDTPDEIVEILRDAGCVFAEDEARLLTAAAGSPVDAERLAGLVRRRVAGEPLEVILGWVEFDGLRLRVEAGVFVPRQRSVFLVERAARLARPGDLVLDLCCGVGALGAALAARVPGLRVLAGDVDPVAVSCARSNLGGARVFLGDLFEAVPDELAGTLDLIVVNAPYVPTAELIMMPSEARDHEPRQALDGGEDGLDVHRRILADATTWLRPGGSLLIECGASMAGASAAAARSAGLIATVAHDDDREATVVSAIREPSDEPEVPLLGGDVTEGVVRIGSTVRRPPGPNSAAVHAVLEHLVDVGFAGAPRFLGLDRAGREVLTFVEGEVAGRPPPDWIGDEARLVSVARLLRRYDDAVAGIVLPAGIRPDRGIPDIGLPPLPDEPTEVLGHQDVTPENVVFSPAGEAIALIDFDLLKPCSRLAEVINALIWWAPLTDPVDRDPRLAGLDVPRRCRVFADAYGLGASARADLVGSALIMADRSWLLMQHRARHLGGGWARMWDDGVGEVIRRRRDWLRREGPAITEALLHES